jgi:T4 gene Gp59 loader of gp41 DNA helicase/T4 gene Gp59 loader of gp41 DNA helicase C-term
MMPVDAYKCYLSLKNHFTKDSYDYHKYCGKSRATVQSFYKRKDRFWFEKIARQKTDKEVEEFFVSNFITSTDPSKLWIGEMIREGDERYTQWKKRTQSLSYIFKEECEKLFGETKIDDVFKTKRGHPIVLKKFLSGEVSIESLVVLDHILEFRKKFDTNLKDPVWESVSMKMKKYSPFLHINVPRYKTILKEIVLGDQ